MNILVLLLLLLNINLFGQDPSQELATNQTASLKKKYEYTPHTIGISTRLNGVGRFNVRGCSEHFLSTTTVDFYLGKRRGKTRLASLLQLRLSGGSPDSLQPEYPLLDEFRWGVLLGGSQYIFDKRLEQGNGWSMLVNGGVSIDLPTINRIISDPLISAANLGIELDFKALYNFNKYTAISFGANIGYVVGYSLRGLPTFGQDGFPIPSSPKGTYIEHAFVAGLTIGVLF